MALYFTAGIFPWELLLFGLCLIGVSILLNKRNWQFDASHLVGCIPRMQCTLRVTRWRVLSRKVSWRILMTINLFVRVDISWDQINALLIHCENKVFGDKDPAVCRMSPKMKRQVRLEHCSKLDRPPTPQMIFRLGAVPTGWAPPNHMRRIIIYVW